MQVYQVKVSNMGSSRILNTVYLCKTMAQLVAAKAQEEWATYSVQRVSAEEISDDRCIIGDRVFKLDRTEGVGSLIETAKAKLTQAEQVAVGLDAPDNDSLETYFRELVGRSAGRQFDCSVTVDEDNKVSFYVAPVSGDGVMAEFSVHVNTLQRLPLGRVDDQS